MENPQDEFDDPHFDTASLDSANLNSASRSHSVYSKPVLKLYDSWVLGLSNRLAWKCPTSTILDWYNQHVSDCHLDVGVGSGYFLDRCQFPSGSPHIELLDANINALDFAAKRIKRFQPVVHQADILKPIELELPKFDSIGINYLLHCLPGNVKQKSIALDHLLSHLAPDGTLFGSTILGQGVNKNWLARRLIKAYNRRGIFGNKHDTLKCLRDELSERFFGVEIEVSGCVAIFAAKSVRTNYVREST